MFDDQMVLCTDGRSHVVPDNAAAAWREEQDEKFVIRYFDIIQKTDKIKISVLRLKLVYPNTSYSSRQSAPYRSAGTEGWSHPCDVGLFGGLIAGAQAVGIATPT